MIISEVLKIGGQKLKQKGIDNPYNTARILLSNVINVKKEYCISHDSKDISIENFEKFNKNVDKIIKGYPLQYITKYQEFMKINFYVDERVLIPQPDTEILVEKVIKLCSKYNEKNINILDLCTGSGAIGISIKKYVENSIVTVSDISKQAINVARINAKKNNVDIKFVESDLFNKIEKKFDIIVSNPPYIETNILDKLPKDVKYEPILALDGGSDGLKYYRNIVQNAYLFLNDNGYLALEIGYNQKNKVMDIIKKTEKYKEIIAIKDLSNNDRVIISRI